MRRQRSVRSDSLISSNNGEQGFWPSYADMMSAIALILFFLMLLSYIQNLFTGNNLQETQEQLNSTKSALIASWEELSRTQQSLDETELALAESNATLITTLGKVDEAQKDLQAVTTQLDSANLTLQSQQTQMSEQELALAQQALLLAEKTDRIAELDEYLQAANTQILEMQTTMKSLAYFRLSVLEQVRESLINVTGSRNAVSISDNGSIVLASSVLFDSASFDIKEEAYPVLKQVINVFTNFFRDNDSVKYVDSIMISGHTDWDGTDADNLLLSTNRANAVLNFLLDEENGSLAEYTSYFCSAGFGESRPVESNLTEEGKAANRRIEISITLKDDSIMNIVDRYLELDLPNQ